MKILAALQQRLFRWQSDGSGPFRLGQRRVFILPTRGGLLYALTLLVMLLAAINYNLALGHALVFLLAGLGISGMVHTFRNLYGLRIAAGRCSAVFAGETAHFPLQLSNDRPSARLALSFAVAPAQTVDYTLAANATGEIALPVHAPRRGWLELPRVRLSTVYPLGLFVAWSYLQPSMRCLVYPQALPTPLPPGSPSANAGANRAAGSQEDFAGFRPRQPADSPRHVAWKASARDVEPRPLLVTQFSGSADTVLQLDWTLTNPNWPLEMRLSQLTGWVLAADAAAACYGLRLPGHQIEAGSGSAQRQHCLETLALFQP